MISTSTCKGSGVSGDIGINMLPDSLFCLLAYEQYIAMMIEPRKLVMGVPWYGYDYPCLSLSQVRFYQVSGMLPACLSQLNVCHDSALWILLLQKDMHMSHEYLLCSCHLISSADVFLSMCGLGIGFFKFCIYVSPCNRDSGFHYIQSAVIKVSK